MPPQGGARLQASCARFQRFEGGRDGAPVDGSLRRLLSRQLAAGTAPRDWNLGGLPGIQRGLQSADQPVGLGIFLGRTGNQP